MSNIFTDAREDQVSLVNNAMQAVGQYIRDEKLSPGDRLPSESRFAETLGISRTVVREAFRSLSALSIISQSPGRRAEVATISSEPVAALLGHGFSTAQVSVREIYDVRRILEARIVVLAALHRTDEQAANLLRLVQLMEAHSDDPDQLMVSDLAFHEALADASKNRVYGLILRSFRAITEETWPIGWRTRTSDASRNRILQIHKDIANAVSDRDPVQANNSMTEHFEDSLSNLDKAGVV